MRRPLILLTAATVVLAGCGNGGPARTTRTSAAPAVSLSGPVNDHGTRALTGRELAMELDDFYFKPTFVKAAGGAKVTVKLENEGKAPHTFTIDALGVDEVLQPGDTKTVTLSLPASGTVAFYCRFHRSQGMQGAFALGAPSAAAGGY